MKERPFADDEAETAELDLDSTDESLEEAMREALDAVEKPAVEKAEELPFETETQTLADLRDELKLERDRSIRTLADFDNFRKRVDRERAEQSRYAGSEVLRDMLAVVDNLERALEADGSGEELRTGVELILRQLEDLLKRHGVERVGTEDARFDPTAHEAVVRHESNDVDEPTIVKDLQTGYWLRDRLLRPALVEVAVPSAPPSQAERAESPDETEH